MNNPFEAETNEIRARGEQALGALREKQKDLEGYKEKTDTLIDTISGAVTGVGATAGAVGAGVAKGGKALAGAAKLFVKELVAEQHDSQKMIREEMLRVLTL